MARGCFGTMAHGGETNGAGPGLRASNGAIGGNTELGAMTGAAIATGMTGTTRDDGTVSKTGTTADVIEIEIIAGRPDERATNNQSSARDVGGLIVFAAPPSRQSAKDYRTAVLGVDRQVRL